MDVHFKLTIRVQTALLQCHAILDCIDHDLASSLSSYINWINIPDSKVYGANMGPTWVLSAPDACWPHEPCYQGSLLHELYVLTDNGWTDWSLYMGIDSDSDIFFVLCCGLVSVNFTQIHQDFFTGTWVITQLLLQNQWSNPPTHRLLTVWHDTVVVSPDGGGGGGMCKITTPIVKQSRASQWRSCASCGLDANVDLVHCDHA